jgi:hypothetical protein
VCQPPQDTCSTINRNQNHKHKHKHSTRTHGSVLTDNTSPEQPHRCCEGWQQGVSSESSPTMNLSSVHAPTGLAPLATPPQAAGSAGPRPPLCTLVCRSPAKRSHQQAATSTQCSPMPRGNTTMHACMQGWTSHRWQRRTTAAVQTATKKRGGGQRRSMHADLFAKRPQTALGVHASRVKRAQGDLSDGHGL